MSSSSNDNNNDNDDASSQQQWIVVETTYPTTYGCNRGRTWSRIAMIMNSHRSRSTTTYTSRDEAVKAARKKRNQSEYFENACAPPDPDDDSDYDSEDDDDDDEYYNKEYIRINHLGTQQIWKIGIMMMKCGLR